MTDGFFCFGFVAKCKAAIDTATTTSFAVLFSSNAEFDFFCE